MEQNINIIKIISWVEKNTRRYDPGHGISHALKVWENACNICVGENLKIDDSLMVACVMLGHDVRDHKMVQRNIAPTCEEALRIYTDVLGEEKAKIVMFIHENCSWSKKENSKQAGEYEWLRLLLQDADWLEAIGEIGLQRCIEYNIRFAHKDIEKYVVDHIYEKLFKIPAALTYAASHELVKNRNLIEPLHTYLRLHEVKM